MLCLDTQRAIPQCGYTAGEEQAVGATGDRDRWPDSAARAIIIFQDRIFMRCSAILTWVLCALLLPMQTLFLSAQTESVQTEPTQTIRGKVINPRSQQPIAGATVQVLSTKMGSICKQDGSFRIDKVPVGRYDIRISSVGYEPQVRNVIVASGKEEVLTVELVERITKAEEITVSGSKGAAVPINEAALVSAAVFSVDDVERYAGSRGDPARMAQNFAGVLGASDLRNDIIIRGGSPAELLWRMDGLDIPNPNHFATQGATGGPVSAINSNLLDNSDFFTGAFTAEYGDRASGVFDLHTRRGNREKYEYLGQFGFNGLEVMAEGPVPGVDGSFIIDYRKSFLDIMEKMGMDFGVSGVPKYQDLTVKLDLTASANDMVSLTGLYGTSDIFIDETKGDSVFSGDENVNTGTDLAALGVRWQHLFSEQLYSKLLVGSVYGFYRTEVDSLTAQNYKAIDRTPWWRSRSREGYHTARYTLHYSPDVQHYIDGGVESRMRYYTLYQERLTMDPEGTSRYHINTDGSALQMLQYVNWNWRINEELTSNVGVHMQYLDVDKQVSIEPRASLAWKIDQQHSLSAGVGIYRQSQPLLLYFGAKGNEKLDFTQSVHYVAGYTFAPAQDLVLKVEGYYKQLSNAPVERDSASAYSFLNTGADFGSVGDGLALTSTGKGRTYGAEFSMFKNFTNGYYTTITASIVRQEYTGSDGIWRFGAFDNRYVANILAGYEWKLSPSFSIEFSGKFTVAGGAPYTPIDLEKSRQYKSTHFDRDKAFSMRNPAYSRLDARIDFRKNFESFSITGFVSVENVLDKQNIQERGYDVERDRVKEFYQLGLFPIGGFKIEF